MVKQENTQLFEETPVLKAVIALEIPTVISQLITLVYNMADTFFIGQVGDPNQVAAASICLPLFMLLTGMANLFGIGGASLITRSLGRGDPEHARRASAFSLWGAGSVALVYGLYAFTLPNTPPKGKPAEGEKSDALGLGAFAMFKDWKFNCFLI